LTMASNVNRTREKLACKIAVLRRWALEGMPPEQRDRAPKSIRQLASWTDAGLGLEAIGSPNAVSTKGPHGELVKEALDYLGRLRVVERRAEKKGERLARLDAELAEARERMGKLAGAWHMARERASELEDDCASQAARIGELEAENARLKRLLADVVPLRRKE
jgi:hypothetical protein